MADEEHGEDDVENPHRYAGQVQNLKQAAASEKGTRSCEEWKRSKQFALAHGISTFNAMI